MKRKYKLEIIDLIPVIVILGLIIGGVFVIINATNSEIQKYNNWCKMICFDNNISEDKCNCELMAY